MLLAACLLPTQRKPAADGHHLKCYSRCVQIVANGTSEAENGKQYDYDFFSIGGGTGGVRAARWSAMNFGKSQGHPDQSFSAQYLNVGARSRKSSWRA